MHSHGVVILDDPGVMRDGFSALLGAHADFGPVLPAGSEEQVVTLATTVAPDLVIVNLEARTFDPIEAARSARATTARTAILALTAEATDSQILLCFKAGFEGLISLREPARSVLNAAAMVAQGERVIADEVVARHELLKRSTINEPKAGRLTNREMQVVRLTAMGLTTGEIGERNRRSPRTVENQLQSAMRKLDARSRVDVVRWAIREGIAHP